MKTIENQPGKLKIVIDETLVCSYNIKESQRDHFAEFP